ncbi:MAG: 30S ribosomal protein S6 [Chloroflexota bacterium]
MRDYEVTVVIQPQLEEAERNQLIERIAELLVPGQKEEDITINQWGLRRLAYPVKKFEEGYYVFYEANIDPTSLVEIERTMRYIEDVLRYLVIRKDE